MPQPQTVDKNRAESNIFKVAPFQLRPYAIALLAVAIAWGVMLLLDPYVAMSSSPFLLFFGAVLVSAWYGGLGPGLLATVLSAVLSTFFLAPTYSLSVDLGNTLRLFLFGLEGVAFSVFCGALRAEKRRTETNLLKLRASELQYRRIVETANEAIWVVDAEWRTTYVNDRMAEMFGYSLEEMRDRPIFDFMDRVARTEAQQHIEQCQQGIKEQFEFRYRRKDGSDLWAIVSSNPIMDDRGTFMGRLAMIVDISDRVRAEEILRRSELELADFFENAVVSLHWVGPDGYILRANKAEMDLLGYTRDEYLGHHISEFYADTKEIDDILQRLTIGETLHNCEARLKCKDGSIKQVLIDSNVLWENGQFIHSRCFTRDITLRKQLESALSQSEKRYRNFVEQSSEGIWRFEIEQSISIESPEDEQIQHFYKYAYLAECNNVMAEMYGLSSAQDLVNLRLKDFILPSDPHNIEYLRNFIRSGYRLTDAESHELDKDGNSKYFLNNLVGTVENGYLIRAWGTQRDITQLKRLEENLQESESRFRIMADTAPVLLWMSGLDKLRDYFNKVWLDFTGRTLEEEMGNGWAMGVHPDDFQRCLDTYVTAFDDRQKFQMEYRLRRFDGEYRWILDTGIPRFTPDGSFVGYIGSCIDISDRKYAEEALRASEEQIRLITDSVPLLISYIDASGRYIFNNKAYEEWFGHHRTEITGKLLKEVLGEAAYQQVQSYMDAALLGQKVSFENAIPYKDGGQRYVEAIYVPHLGEEGQVKGFVALVNDITDRKQAEKEIVKLNQSLQRRVAELQTLFEVMPIGIAIASDAECQRISVNPILAQHLQLPPDANASLSAPIQERPSNFKVNKNGRELTVEELPMQRCAAKGVEVLDEEIDIIYENGKIVKMLVSAAPLFDEEGKSRGCVAAFLDITARKAAEEGQRFLAEASNVLASSLDYSETLQNVAQLAVPQIADWCTVHTIEEDGSVQQLAVAHVNPAKVKWAHELQRRYPFDPNEPRGVAQVLRSGDSEIYPTIPDDLLVASARDAEHLEIMREIGFSSAILVPIRVGDASDPQAKRLRTLGAISFIAASGRHYQQADLEIAESLASRAALAIENSRLYALAQRARQFSEAAQASAEAANRMKDEFLATVSHELRTPLTAILGWARLLRSQTLDDATQERAIETIERNAKSQAQLVEDILDVSRIITGKLRLDVRPIELVSIIEKALDSIRPAAEAKSISLRSVLDPWAGPVSGDPERLQQVVWNLLSNAIKFTPKKGYVQILLERINSHVEITVSDTGSGIDAEFLPYVFDRFRQAEGGSTRAHGGLGLGLAIVRHLVELHGGTVYVVSPGEGQGATFTVKLPVSIVHADLRNSGRASNTASDDVLFNNAPVLDGVRVLVVEDDADARELIAIALESCGADVTAVASALLALEAIAALKPDVLISDIEMPGEDGYTLIRQVRALTAGQGGRVPAAALTAYARGEDRRRALLAGFQMHVAKPVDPAELVAVVANLAGRTV